MVDNAAEVKPRAPAGDGEVGPPVVPRVALRDVDVVKERVAHMPHRIEPSFNVRHLRRKLEDPACSSKEAEKLPLGLHHKLWHLPLREIQGLF